MTADQLRDATIRDTTGQLNPFRVLSTKLVAGRIKVLDTGSWTERYEEYEAIRDGVGTGRFHVEREGDIPPAVLLQRTPKDDQKHSDAMHVVALIKERMRQDGISANRAYIQIVKEYQEKAKDEKPLPSRATVYRLLERDAKGRPLVIGDAAKGNREPRYSQAIRDLIVEQAELHYLVPKSRWSLFRLTEHITLLAQSEKLIPNTTKLSRAYVKRVISDEACSDDEKARMSPRDVAAGKSIAREQIRVSMPLQRVEQDALHLPFIARTPWGISSAIYLVYSIDCRLSIHTGWTLVVGAPTASDSLRCVERTLFPKADLLRALGVKADIDLYGTPSQILYDNGPENLGERMRNLTRIGIKPMYCKARHAQGKPFIERSNRSLKEALEVLPGCTRFDGRDGKRDPIAEGDELMDIEELERWIVRWFYEGWVHTPLKRLRDAVFIDDFRGFTPAQVFEDFKRQEMAMPLPPNLKEWHLVKYEQRICTLSRKTGITFDTFNFAGKNLDRLIDLVGETPVTVLIDPDDFRFVYVVLGEDIELVRLNNKWVDERTPAYSFKRAKEIRSEKPANSYGKDAAEAFMRKVYARATATSSPDSAPKRNTRATSKETRQRAKEHAATARAAQTPFGSVDPAHQGPVWNEGEVVWSSEEVGVFEVRSSAPEGEKP